MIHDKPFALGRTAEIFAWQDNTVLKLFYEWVPLQDALHEAGIHRTLQTHHLPIPHLIQEIQINGRAGIVYERVQGSNMLTMLFQKPWLLPHLIKKMADLQYQIHQVEIPDLPLLKVKIQRDISSVLSLTQTEKDHLLDLLEQLPVRQNLCHFDFHPGQIILTETGPVIVDWITACQGDPAADIARTLILLRFSNLPKASFFKQLTIKTIRRWISRLYLNQLRKQDPRLELKIIEAWMLPIAAARLSENVTNEEQRILTWIRKRV